ncbi:ribosome assembly factor SBDS [Candidatus Woesearchaeota archaeon]|nr:ribosome assembly factor SBDS [Candidatus Woesearchaeota archaeon]
MVTVDKAIVARIDKGGKHFEILVDAEMAYDLKSGKVVSIGKMLATTEVYSDARKGMRVSSAELEKQFGTSETEKVADQIVKHGDLQLTTDFRRKKAEEKRKQIIAVIARTAVDPRTKLPHPPERISNAMDQARISVDPFKPAEQQVDDVIKAIKPIIPISFEEIELTVEIPVQHGSHVLHAIKEFGSSQNQWLTDRLIVKIKIPAALKEAFYRRINGLTNGEAKIIEK